MSAITVISKLHLVFLVFMYIRNLDFLIISQRSNNIPYVDPECSAFMHFVGFYNFFLPFVLSFPLDCYMISPYAFTCAHIFVLCNYQMLSVLICVYISTVVFCGHTVMLLMSF